MSARNRPAHTAARVEAQAKLNLFLRVLAREESGYHLIETLFQRIALADTVTVRTDVAGRSLDCDDAATGPADKNLGWRAATVFAAATGWPAGFAIEITKRIPVGGGLGGGSADGAAVLRALNALAPAPLGPGPLSDLAFELGADVPYLLGAHALALGTGRGERLLGLTALPARAVLLLVPPFGVASREAFAWHAESRGGGSPPSRRDALVVPSPLDWDAVANQSTNDLEGCVFGRHPQLAELRDALDRSGARLARMTGSGSTIFGVYDASDRAPDKGLAAELQVNAADAKRIETRTVEGVASVELI